MAISHAVPANLINEMASGSSDKESKVTVTSETMEGQSKLDNGKLRESPHSSSLGDDNSSSSLQVKESNIDCDLMSKCLTQTSLTAITSSSLFSTTEVISFSTSITTSS